GAVLFLPSGGNDQLRQVPSQNVFAAVAEHFLRRRIPSQNLSVVFKKHDRVRRGLQDRLLMRLAPDPGPLDLPPLGNVRHRPNHVLSPVSSPTGCRCLPARPTENLARPGVESLARGCVAGHRRNDRPALARSAGPPGRRRQGCSFAQPENPPPCPRRGWLRPSTKPTVSPGRRTE